MPVRPLVALAFVATFAMPKLAGAEQCSREEMAAAKPHFNSGAKAFRIGELQKAAEEFKAAYEACASPLFLYNLGQTYRQLKDPEKALYFYKQYLSTTPTTDERRADVQKWIEQLQREVADAAAANHALERSPAPSPPPPVPTAPASTPNASPTKHADLVVRDAAPSRKKPIYKQWWLWTAVGVVATGAAVGLALGVEHAKSSGYTAPGVTF